MEQSDWNNIVLDKAAVPRPLSDERFTHWMAGRRVFISSVMDDEMTPYRKAIRTYLETFGRGTAVMWETFSPQDIDPKKAFLGGVDQSNVFLLVLGARYGVADDSGYSPIHQEARRAKSRHIPRLVFTLPVAPSSRAGPLNDWLRELHNDISGNTVASPEEMVAGLDARLREYAARSERQWLKLGDCIFPGVVVPEADHQGRRKFTVTARAYNHEVRRALMTLTDGRRASGTIRLTYVTDSHLVQVVSVKQTQEYVGEADIEIVCQTPANQYGNDSAVYSMVVNNETPESQTAKWLRQALLGEAPPSASSHEAIFNRPERPTLPEVLAATDATGWQAEGIARLYAVEQLARRRGGRFISLNVERATAGGIPLSGQFTLDHFGNPSAPTVFAGVVPTKTARAASDDAAVF